MKIYDGRLLTGLLTRENGHLKCRATDNFRTVALAIMGWQCYHTQNLNCYASLGIPGFFGQNQLGQLVRVLNLPVHGH
jgi:hypothetical protein